MPTCYHLAQSASNARQAVLEYAIEHGVNLQFMMRHDRLN